MGQRIKIIIGCVLIGACVVWGQQTDGGGGTGGTAYSKQLLRATNAGQARSIIGVSTNNPVFNTDQFDTTGPIALKPGAKMSNAVFTGTLTFDTGVTISTTPTNTSVSANTVFVADKFQGSGSVAGDFIGSGAGLTDINGQQIRTGTIKTNAVDWAQWPVVYPLPSRPDRFIKSNNTFIESDYRSDAGYDGNYNAYHLYFPRISPGDAAWGDRAYYAVPKSYVKNTNAITEFYLVSTNTTLASLRFEFVPLPTWTQANATNFEGFVQRTVATVLLTNGVVATVAFTNSWTNITDTLSISLILNTTAPTNEFCLIGGRVSTF